MGREALLTALNWLTLSVTLAVKDSVSAETAPLYRNAQGVYAAPYGAYSFHLPAITIPQPAPSNVAPVKESSPYQNLNGYLKDSYGNRFVQSVQAIPFKPFPQQYVSLQALPAHFAQPLTAGPAPAIGQPAAGYHYKQTVPVVIGSHYRFPLQAAPNFSFGHHTVHADPSKGQTLSSSFGPQFQGQVVQVPLHSSTQGSSLHQPDYSRVVSINHQVSTAQPEPSSNKAVYTDTQTHEYHSLKNEPKFQRLEEAPQESSEEEQPLGPLRPTHKQKQKLTVTSIRDTPVPTVVNGKKTVVNVETKPPIPLLDISLLEPLTFDNPLVPQVQHYLPRINQATYHKLSELEEGGDQKYQKEFVVNKNKSYDSGVRKGKPKKVGLKKKQRPRPVPQDDIYQDVYIPQATARPTVTITGINEAPEITYEIHTPNGKETYKEKVIKYNRETQSEPENYSYESNTQNDPENYSYTHNSKEPIHIKEERYEGRGQSPKHLIYKFKPKEENKGNSNQESEDSRESSEQSVDETPNSGSHYDHHQERSHGSKPSYKQNENHQKSHHEHHREGPKPSHKVYDAHHETHREQHRHSPKPSHKQYDHHHESQHEHRKDGPTPTHNDGVDYGEQKYHHKPSSDEHHNVNSHHEVPPTQYYPLVQFEENIRLANVKVDPGQHLQPTPQPQNSQPQSQSRPSSAPQQQHLKHHDVTPVNYVQEKTKQVYIKEVIPEHDQFENAFGEELMKAMSGADEEREKDFEKAYKNAAFGFPAYYKTSEDIEKDIYSPEAFGVPREYMNQNFGHSAFQQYTAQGDEFPKSARLGYKDELGKMKENYFLDYSVSKPESLTDRYKNKVNYYNLYKNQKPEKYLSDSSVDKNKQSEKLTAYPYGFYPVQDPKMKQYLAHFKNGPFMASPVVYGYDYSKSTPRDNSAHASRPLQSYKTSTHFVEPQFQFGFEPIALPRLLDSELSAMASNVSPEKEPGTRKKIYKENFYIKRTSLEPSR